VSFAWQGGEPTLLGVGYFRQVVALNSTRGSASKRCRPTASCSTTPGRVPARARLLVGLSSTVKGTIASASTGRQAGRRRRARHAGRCSAASTTTLTVVHRDTARRAVEVYDTLTSLAASCSSSHRRARPVPSDRSRGDAP
jgi:hypothetical protein